MNHGVRLAAASALLLAVPVALLLLGAELGWRLAGDMLAYMALGCAAYVAHSVGAAPFWAWGAVAALVDMAARMLWDAEIASALDAPTSEVAAGLSALGVFAIRLALAALFGVCAGGAIYVLSRDFTPRGVAATSLGLLLLWMGLGPNAFETSETTPPRAAEFAFAALAVFLAVVATRVFIDHPIARAEGRGAIARDRAAALGFDRDMARRRALLLAGALAGVAGPIAGLGDHPHPRPPLPEPFYSLSLAAMMWLAAGRGVHASMFALAAAAAPPAIVFATIGGGAEIAGWWIGGLVCFVAFLRAIAGRPSP